MSGPLFVYKYHNSLMSPYKVSIILFLDIMLLCNFTTYFYMSWNELGCAVYFI